MKDLLIVKDRVLELSKTMAAPMIVSLFEGIAAPASIYRWIKGAKTDDELVMEFSEDQLKKEVKHYRDAAGNYDGRPCNNKLVLQFQPGFYAHERELWKDPTIRANLIENRKKYLFKETFSTAEILRGFKISGVYNGYSHFVSLWIKQFIHDYQITNLYDPCGGWGHRLVGSLNINYKYNDVWDQSCIGVEKIAKFCNADFLITNNDCTTVATQNDVCFTCPPYFNNETYSTRYRDIADYNEFLEQLVAMNPAKLWGIVINTKYFDNVKNAFTKSNYTLSKEIQLGKSYSHFTGKTKTNKEWLLVFNP